ncbi:helix-turn-helix domain-containing protein [Nocardia sp. ET3-3]|uniref:Helix-turn-helix domain-containing protein n=1 Tax=Nocardia terrae TaxID=2675851 RepID=A0A7K1V970_9NOCA|nr:helix-turn-helix domain-containing protein [Nocardia terrae]
MRNLVFESDDLGATEDFLNSAYTKMSIGNDSPAGGSASIRRDMLGQVSLDRLDLRFAMRYDADPLEKVCLCVVETGSIEETYRDTGVDVFLPGQVGLLTPPELPYEGVIHSSRYRIVMFDPRLLNRVGGTADDREAIRFTGHRPISPAAGTRLKRVLEHLQDVAADPDASASPLVASTAADYLAATVLDTLPTTTVAEPSAADRHDAHADTVRRAIAYMESHLREDISVAEIAAACFVTVRSLQLAFRRHLDTTPTGRLRRMRLHAAREELRALSPGDGHTVTSTAQRWGFAHPGRFAIEYRRAYGQSPSATLRG